ncbi:MAG: DUF6970 domain-containing protein [Chitinophagales bacterium]
MNFPKGTPTCIRNKINKEKSSYCNEADVKQYVFNGRDVYVFNIQSCFADGGSEVLDQDCNDVCFLGGFGGFTDCEGVNFENDAEFVQTIWENN